MQTVLLNSAVASAITAWRTRHAVVAGSRKNEIMYYVYVLKSLRNGKRYVGYTSKLPEDRLNEHNAGTNKHTKINGPFEVVYKEEFSNKSLAIRRERFLKSGHGREFLNSIIPR